MRTATLAALNIAWVFVNLTRLWRKEARRVWAAHVGQFSCEFHGQRTKAPTRTGAFVACRRRVATPRNGTTHGRAGGGFAASLTVITDTAPANEGRVGASNGDLQGDVSAGPVTLLHRHGGIR